MCWSARPAAAISTDIMPRLLNRFAGTKFKIISGYKGTGDGMLAMERGEVEGIVGHELSALRAPGRTGCATTRRAS